MPKLFVDFEGTLLALKSGRVTGEELTSGLFVFDCTRHDAITNSGHYLYVFPIVIERPDLLKQLAAALLKAESEGRACFPATHGDSSFEMIDELLVSNGYKPLMSEDQYYNHNSISRLFHYPAVQGRCTELDVIWHA